MFDENNKNDDSERCLENIGLITDSIRTQKDAVINNATIIPKIREQVSRYRAKVYSRNTKDLHERDGEYKIQESISIEHFLHTNKKSSCIAENPQWRSNEHKIKIDPHCKHQVRPNNIPIPYPQHNEVLPQHPQTHRHD